MFAPGSSNSSVLNLIAATMGAGTITMPYIICVAGIGLGAILTILGACLSHYTGNLLVSSLSKLGSLVQDSDEVAVSCMQLAHIEITCCYQHAMQSS